MNNSETLIGDVSSEFSQFVVGSGLHDFLKANAIHDDKDLLDLRSCEVLSKTGLPMDRERLRVVLRDGPSQRVCYLKTYVDDFARIGRKRHPVPRAEHEWHLLSALAANGIPSATPIALARRKLADGKVRSAILLGEVPGRSLETMLGSSPTLEGRLRSVIPMLAALVRRFHHAGFVHRDLYASHVFWDPRAAPEQSLHLIDVQRIIRPRWFRSRWIVKDLASLNYSAQALGVSSTSRMRFLKEYLKVDKLPSSGRRLAYRILGKTLRIARHEIRRKTRLKERHS